MKKLIHYSRVKFLKVSGELGGGGGGEEGVGGNFIIVLSKGVVFI